MGRGTTALETTVPFSLMRAVKAGTCTGSGNCAGVMGRVNGDSHEVMRSLVLQLLKRFFLGLPAGSS